MGRKVRILQMPLQPLRNTNIRNPVLSHWALLIGQNDILLEIFPKEGPNALMPLNELRISWSVNLKARKAEFKFGIFPQSDTDKSDEDIIKEGLPTHQANTIIRRNPYYNLVGYNCQSFVNDLSEAIAIKNFATELKKGLRRWVWWAKPILYRGDDGTELIDPAQEAAAELEFLIEHGKSLQPIEGTTEKVEYKVPDISLDIQVSNESMELKPFSPKDQGYLIIEQGDDLVSGGDGLVYGLTEDPAYKLADIPVPVNPRHMLSDQAAKLEVAEALVGEEK
ncbi:hypothetical protein F4810DRAFT_547705 [Camillea tinctor]|nr:hypothetical protein F4810DRAFT_547705 [Camillea tinctor]